MGIGLIPYNDPQDQRKPYKVKQTHCNAFTLQTFQQAFRQKISPNWGCGNSLCGKKKRKKLQNVMA